MCARGPTKKQMQTFESFKFSVFEWRLNVEELYFPSMMIMFFSVSVSKCSWTSGIILLFTSFCVLALDTCPF